MSTRRGRSARSYIAEFGLAALAVLAIYLFMTQGGPQVVGDWFAGMMQTGGN